jgi:hypothetical protein
VITLPASPAPNGAEAELIDFGMIQRPALGARATRIDRPGNRYRVVISFPPMKSELSRVFVSRLIAAKSEGLRVKFPLLRQHQGSPGTAVVVDGAGQAGKTLAIRGLTPNYAFREGYWLSIVDDAGGGDGAAYLHNCRSTVAANAAGEATIVLAEALRWPFGDGATVLLAQPVIEGFVTGEAWSWQIPVNGLIQLSVPIEECG